MTEHEQSASALLKRISATAGIGAEVVDEIFRGVPVDFPVKIARRLPLGADRLGMAGITLFRRVYLIERVMDYPAAELIALVRHEAEHVRQQREDRLFYLRYAWQWLAGMLGGVGRVRSEGLAKVAHAAYRSILAEREAYAADRIARRRLVERDQFS